MKTVIPCGELAGRIKIPASKSQAHRILICAALGKTETKVICDGISKDIKATVDCLCALGADITLKDGGVLNVHPIKEIPTNRVVLRCGESGSTLRFMLPVVGVLGADAEFIMEGRLPERPLAPLDEQLVMHGMTLEKYKDRLICGGKLSAGSYTLPGNVSSQYISGLLMALPLADGESTLHIVGNIESKSYISMTEDAIKLSKVNIIAKETEYIIPGNTKYELPSICEVEGDYSNAAFFLCAGAFSEKGVTVDGLRPDSSQGDKAVLEILKIFGADVTENGSSVTVKKAELKGTQIDAAPIPDLIPVLSVVAAAADGETRVINAGRLRIKESDRLRSTADLLSSVGAEVSELEDGLVICGKKKLCGGNVASYNDHRIAMSAAVASSVCSGDIILDDGKCVEKSYPRFWHDLKIMKGTER